jgi:hypothetical protein
MGPLGWILILVAALITVCVAVIRKISTQQRMVGIGPNDESANAAVNMYQSRTYYPSSSLTRTSDVLSDMLVCGAVSSMRAPNGNGAANSSEPLASEVQGSSSSNDGQSCDDDASSSCSDFDSSSDSGSN